MYGGGDPKIVYHRERIVEPRMHAGQILHESVVHVPGHLAMWLPIERYRTSRVGDIQHEYVGIAVAGRYYVVYQTFQIEEGFEFSNVRKLIQKWTVLGPQEGTTRRIQNDSASYVPGQKYASLIELSRLVNAPVFKTVAGYGWSQAIEGRVPVLSDFGIASHLSAEQCYQEIAMFISLLKENPDESPESKPPLTNEEKAVAHGFDKRISFRHRK
jgi:hypothetical protein